MASSGSLSEDSSQESPIKPSRRDSIEVETIENDMFEILDSAMDLGTLDFGIVYRSVVVINLILIPISIEYSETKRNLALRKNQGSYVPIDLFRGAAGSRSVTVSDISSSLWCELQTEYRYLHPYLTRTSEWIRRKETGRSIEQRTEQMVRGSVIHYEKEREIREMVEVVTVTKEDRCAIDLINTAVKLQSIREGNIEREIKLTGRVFGSDMLVTGIIDQIQYCISDNSLTVLELKTRKVKSVPSDKQRQAHHFQVMLYKNLLDSFTQGLYDSYSELLSQKGLKVGLPLSAGPVGYIKERGLDVLLLDHQSFDVITLGQLAEAVSVLVRGLSLPLVDSLLVQYIDQGDKEVIAVEPVIYEEEVVRKVTQSVFEYWKGKREAMGVDIEDSWKCGSCQFRDVCVWRRKQVMENSPVKKWPKEFYQPSAAAIN